MIRRRKFCAWWLVEPFVCITPWGCVCPCDRPMRRSCPSFSSVFLTLQFGCLSPPIVQTYSSFSAVSSMWRVLLTQVNFFCKHELNGLVSAGFALLVFRRAWVSVKVWSTTVPTFTIVSSGVAAIAWLVAGAWLLAILLMVLYPFQMCWGSFLVKLYHVYGLIVFLYLFRLYFA